MHSPVFVKRIWQLDRQRFAIEWTDNTCREYHLRELQEQCPCAACHDETTGQRSSKASPVQEDVSAKAIRSVGHYALRIDFSTGCSNGIFRFDKLYPMGQKLAEPVKAGD